MKSWTSEKKLSQHLVNNPRRYTLESDSKSDAVCFSLEEKSRVSVKDVLNDAIRRNGRRASENELKIAELLVEQKKRELKEAQRRLEDAQGKS